MNWLEVLLIAVWLTLASFLAGLRLAADSRRRTAEDGWWSYGWTASLFKSRRRNADEDANTDTPPTVARQAGGSLLILRKVANGPTSRQP